VAPRTAALAGCPLCGAQTSTLTFVIADHAHGVPGSFAYRRCGACRTVYQDPRVVDEDLPLCYPADYYTHQDFEPAGAMRRPGLRARMRDLVRLGSGDSASAARPLARLLAGSRRMRERAWGVVDELIPPRVPPGRALEVGCGSGGLLRALARVGWEADGLEPDERAAEIARRTSGCAVVGGHLADLGDRRGMYDMIVLHHVFEHLPEPRAALALLASLLAPEGRLLLVYPNPESLGARIFGAAWYPWEAPRHLALPPARALLQAAAGAGLEPVSVRTLSRSALENFQRSHHDETSRASAPRRLRAARDRFLAGCEAAAVSLKLDAGEELAILLARR